MCSNYDYIKNFGIDVFDLTGGWSLDKYSGQKGHKILVKTNLPNNFIHEIKWNFSNGLKSKEKKVKTVFNGFLKEFPGEGFITAKVKVLTNSGKVLKTSRKFLISPVVDCELAFQEYMIGDNTKSINLIGAPLCAFINTGNPFEGREDFPGCAGACEMDCPRFEIFATPVKGTKIKCYGRHRVFSNVRISGGDANPTCIPLYRDDILGKKSKYPPISSKVCIVPQNLSLVSLNLGDGNRKFIIDGLSKFMLCPDSKITWSVYFNGDLKKRFTNHRKSQTFRLRKTGNYRVFAKVHVPRCANQKVSIIISNT